MLQVIDESSTRADLAQRRETKYVLKGISLETLRSVLSMHAKQLIHNEVVSTVRSVYFDDLRWNAYYANVDGLGDRRKVRVRWYDQDLPGSSVFLEVKWRRNRLTGKRRMKLSLDGSFSEWSYRKWYQELLRVAPGEMLPELLQYSEPKILVEYRREHFVSSDGQLRCTLDYELKFYDQTGRQFVSNLFPIRMPNFLVLEGKTPIGRERELKELFAPLTLRAERCSKYVLGCNVLGLVNGSCS